MISCFLCIGCFCIYYFTYYTLDHHSSFGTLILSLQKRISRLREFKSRGQDVRSVADLGPGCTSSAQGTALDCCLVSSLFCVPSLPLSTVAPHMVSPAGHLCRSNAVSCRPRLFSYNQFINGLRVPDRLSGLSALLFISAQVVISRFLRSNTVWGSVLTAWGLLGILFLHLSLSLPCSHSLFLSLSK